MSVRKAQPLIIQRVSLEPMIRDRVDCSPSNMFLQNHVHQAAFASGELLITISPVGYRALIWALQLPSLAWKDTTAHPIFQHLLEAASAIQVIIVLKTVHIQSKHHLGRLLKMEAPLLEVYASLAPLPLNQVKSRALPVQREVPVSAMAPMCLAFADQECTD